MSGRTIVAGLIASIGIAATAMFIGAPNVGANMTSTTTIVVHVSASHAFPITPPIHPTPSHLPTPTDQPAPSDGPSTSSASATGSSSASTSPSPSQSSTTGATP